MEQCVIEFDTQAIVQGVCDPHQYETPYQGSGKYDPNWISCEKLTGLKQNYIYCFHPNQGHGNGVTSEKNNLTVDQTVIKNDLTLPKELPSTGANINSVLGWSAILIGVLMVIVGLIKNRKGKK